MRLTRPMLESMEAALNEVLAGEGFQGMEPKENSRMCLAAHRALAWIAEQFDKRDRRKTAT